MSDRQADIDLVSAEANKILTTMLIVNVTLKAAGLVSWPWRWVLAPFWVPAVLAGALTFIARRVDRDRRP
jgi:hypothetical protein